jgi:hypothetical protein
MTLPVGRYDLLRGRGCNWIGFGVFRIIARHSGNDAALSPAERFKFDLAERRQDHRILKFCRWIARARNAKTPASCTASAPARRSAAIGLMSFTGPHVASASRSNAMTKLAPRLHDRKTR